MKPGNRFPQFFQAIFEHFRTTVSIVSWSIIILGILIFPVFFVFASSLTSSTGTPLFPVSENPPQKRSTRVSPGHIPDPLQKETTPSLSQRPQIFSHHPQYQRPGSTPAQIHLLVDTSQNRLFVKKGDHILYTALASTGSGDTLSDPRNPERVWTFKTPKGIFHIQSKLEKPVWIRPDWAFIEQGQPIPEKITDRLKPGVLGPYALGFGNGYFIHGALYSNLLGQDVTHGCIQVNRKDLEYIWQTIPLGATLIIV
jgi:L,D-transpeptidase YbiS